MAGIDARWVLRALALLALVGCGSDPVDKKPRWEIAQQDLPNALMSVWGTTPDDVWTVGSDFNDGKGPLVMHYDGAQWTRLETGQSGHLWWVFGFVGGPIYMGGAGGLILRYQGGAFTKLTTPGLDTVFGIWGSSPTDVWAVGGATGGASGAFAWKLAGDAWEPGPALPADLSTKALWKVWGRGANDVWLVGTLGTAVHWDGNALTKSSTGIGESLFTVHASSERFVTVGGFGTGTILEHDGTSWSNVSPKGADPLVGVCLTNESGIAVGQFGAVYTRDAGTWKREPTGVTVEKTLHAVWIDPGGDVWAVGGDVQVEPLGHGLLIHRTGEL